MNNKLVTFAQLAEQFEGRTWDYPVESSDDITSAQRDAICNLGYYGKPIKSEHVDMLDKGEKWKTDAPYIIIYNGCDGHDSMEFKNIEEAKEFIVPRIEWTRSDTEIGTEFATYTLVGFKLSDIGIKWTDKLP